MDLNEYQQLARLTTVYRPSDGLLYTACGLAGETGEICDQVKRIIRDDAGVLTPERRAKILEEAGDALWYLSQLVAEAGEELNEVAARNLDKLKKRRERGTLHGEGDR